jgi:hypothetical protein
MTKEEEKKKMKIDSLSDATNLNDINFANKDVIKWAERKKDNRAKAETPELFGLARLSGPSASNFRKRKNK